MCTLVQALRLCTGRTAHRGSRGIALLFHDHGTRLGKRSESHPGRFLPPEKTRYQLYRRLCGPLGQFGRVRNISPPPGFDPRNFQARSQSLYRLRLPVHSSDMTNHKLFGRRIRSCTYLLNAPFFPNNLLSKNWRVSLQFMFICM